MQLTERKYRYAALQSIARNTLIAYDRSLVSGIPRAIPIDMIAEQLLGLRIEYHCLRKNGIVLGETIFDDAQVPVYDLDEQRYTLIPAKSGTIILDTGLLDGGSEGRLRFTLAYEVAHWIIHREMYTGSGHAAAHIDEHVAHAAAHTDEHTDAHTDATTSAHEDSATERQADVLGTYLIMPASQVKRAFYQVRNAKGSDITAELAALFQVSRQAMRIFMEEHRLL